LIISPPNGHSKVSGWPFPFSLVLKIIRCGFGSILKNYYRNTLPKGLKWQKWEVPVI
jgi:hypothetical protein